MAAEREERIATQIMKDNAFIRSFNISSRTDARIISGLRSRNSPVSPPKQVSFDIVVECEFQGDEGIAKLRAIISDFQASFCQPIYHPKISAFLLAQGGEDVFEEQMSELIRFKELLASNRKIDDIKKGNKNITGPYEIKDYEIISTSVEEPRKDGVLIKLRIMKNGREEERLLYVSGLHRCGTKRENEAQAAFVSNYLSKGTNYAIFFGIEQYVPSDTAISITGPARYIVGDIITDTFVSDAKRSRSISLAEYVITKMRSEFGYYTIGIQDGFTGDIFTDTNYQTLVGSVQSYMADLAMLPGSDVAHQYKLGDILDRYLDESVDLSEVLNEIADLYKQSLFVYRVSSADYINQGVIPVALERVDITFNPNSVESVIARFYFQYFHYKAFVDKFEFLAIDEKEGNPRIGTTPKPEDSKPFITYRDNIFLDKWMKRTTDVRVMNKLAKMLEPFKDGGDSKDLYTSLVQYMDNNLFEIIYTPIPSSIAETGYSIIDATKEVSHVPTTISAPPMEHLKPEKNSKNLEAYERLRKLSKVRVPIHLGNTVIDEISINKNWNLAQLPVLGYRFPVFQYMGAGHTMVRIVLRTKDITLVRALKDINFYVTNVYRQMNPELASKAIVLRNDFVNLFDIETVLPLQINIEPVPDAVEEYLITFEAVATDVNKDERLTLLKDSGLQIKDLEELQKRAQSLVKSPGYTLGVGESVLYAVGAFFKYLPRAISHQLSSDELLRNNADITIQNVNDSWYSPDVIKEFLDYLWNFYWYCNEVSEGNAKITSNQLAVLYSTKLNGWGEDDKWSTLIDIYIKYKGLSIESLPFKKALLVFNNIDGIATAVSYYIKGGIDARRGLEPKEKQLLREIEYFIDYVVNNHLALTNAFPAFILGGREVKPLLDRLPFDLANPEANKVLVDVYPDLQLPTYKKVIKHIKYDISDELYNITIAFLEKIGFEVIAVDTDKVVISTEWQNDKFLQNAINESYDTGSFTKLGGFPNKVLVNRNKRFIKNYSSKYEGKSISYYNKKSLYRNFRWFFSIIDFLSLPRQEYYRIYTPSKYSIEVPSYAEILIKSFVDGLFTYKKNPMMLWQSLYNFAMFLDKQDIISMLNEIRKKKVDVDNNQLSLLMPTYSYYGATPPPGYIWNMPAKTIDDFVDPGFFIYDPVLLGESSTEKDYMKTIVKMLDTGKSPFKIFDLMKKHAPVNYGNRSEADVKALAAELKEKITSQETDEGNPVDKSQYLLATTTEMDKIDLDKLPDLDPGVFQHSERFQNVDTYLDKYDLYDLDGMTRTKYMVNDAAEHMVAYTRSMARAYPTAMIWFVEEDTEQIFAFDDMYQYTAVDSIEVFKHKTVADRAIVRVSNVSGVLSQDRFVVINEELYDNLKVNLSRATTNTHASDIDAAGLDFATMEAFQDKIKVRVGTKVIIKLGYTATESLLPTVLIGRIAAIRGGPVLEFEVAGLEVETYNIFSGRWGNLSMPWIAHTMLKHTRDFSRPLGLNVGLDDNQIPYDDPANIWYKLIGGHWIGAPTISFLGSAGVSALFASGLTIPLGIGAVVGIAFLIGAIATAHKSRGGVKDTDDAINIFHNKSPWLLGLNWIHWDIDWLCMHEPMFYNLNKLSKYAPGMIATTRYLDNGGTFYIGPPSGSYIYTRRIPVDILRIHKSLYSKGVSFTPEEKRKIINLFEHNFYNIIRDLIGYTKNLGNSELELKKQINMNLIDGSIENLIRGIVIELKKDITSDLSNKDIYDLVSNKYKETTIDGINVSNVLSVMEVEKDLEFQWSFNHFIIEDLSSTEKDILLGGFRQSKIGAATRLEPNNMYLDIDIPTVFAFCATVIHKVFEDFLSQRDVVDIPVRKELNTKPLRKIHYISSFKDIIANNIYVSTEQMANTIRIGTDIEDFRDNLDDLFELTVDKSIPRNRRITRNIVDPRFTPGLISTIRTLFGEGTGIMLWATCNYLADALKPMYRGELIVVGRPEIEPYDMVYLADAHNNMTGKFEVESVVHTYSKDLGFITIITPHLLTTITDKNDWGVNIVMSVISATAISVAVTSAFFSSLPLILPGIVFGGAYFLNVVNKWGLLPDFSGQGILSDELRNPVMFYPLQYKGVPYVAGVDGMQRGSFWDNIKSNWRRTWTGAGIALDKLATFGYNYFIKNIQEAEYSESGIK